MNRKSPLNLDKLPEIFVSNKEMSSAVSKAVQAGRLRKIASRLYTKNMTEEPAVIVKRNFENMRPSRKRGGAVARTLSKEELEARLESMMRHSGDAALKALSQSEKPTPILRVLDFAQRRLPSDARPFLRISNALSAMGFFSPNDGTPRPSQCPRVSALQKSGMRPAARVVLIELDNVA